MRGIDKILKKTRAEIKKAIMMEVVKHGLVYAAEILIFEIKHREGGHQASEINRVADRLARFMEDTESGWGPDKVRKTIATSLLKEMKQEICVSGSETFCKAWKITKKALKKYINS
jgi:hypothetical protein